MKKHLIAVITAVMLLLLLPATALADGLTVTSGEQTLSGTPNSQTGTTDYVIDTNNATVSVSGSSDNSRIVVTATNVTINLNGVSMIMGHYSGSPLEIAENCSATLNLSGANEISAHAAAAGILVNQGATLTIKEDTATGSLTVSGAQYSRCDNQDDVEVDLMSGYPGIGGPNGSAAEPLIYTGTINIESGIINATGYGFGAAIGGGSYSSGGNITISGGKVTAINGGSDPDGWDGDQYKQASGIGGSQGQASGTINISNAEVTAYGGYGCAGIGGSTANVTISGTAQVTSYGGTYAAGIGGYNQDKGDSTITISDTAQVTAYGGPGASAIGQGSVSSTVNLYIADTATVNAYSDGTKAAITGIPQSGSTNILNIYMQNVELPDYVKGSPLPLTVGTQTVYIAAGYLGVGTNFAAGSYDISLNFPLLDMDYFKIISVSGYSFQVAAGNDATVYAGDRVMLLGVADGGATLQRNPPVGVTIKSNNGEPLVLDDTNGMIIVPPGGSITTADGDTEIWSEGGMVSKGGRLFNNDEESSSSNPSSDTTYRPTIEVGEGGEATVSPSRPERGEEVTITTNPDQGMEVDKVSVTDRYGNTVEVTNNGDGTYSFIQPRGSVTIEVSFKTAVCDGGRDCPSYHFSDIDTSQWYHEAVDYVVANGLMNGTSSTTFSPTTELSRGMLVTILWRMENQPVANYQMTFEDVAEDAYYAEAIRWAASNEIITGHSSSIFSPDEPITREQLATILFRYAQYNGMGAVTLEYNLGGFADIEAISEYAGTAMNWAVGRGIINGKAGNLLDPAGATSRAEAAQMLMKYQQNVAPTLTD